MIKVSIIVPIYNGEQYIESCINSLLEQSYKSVEIIIINDGSTDESEKILERYLQYDCIKIFNNSNHGVSYSRNFGIENAIGDYIMFVDIDDILLPNAVQELVDIVEKDSTIDIIRFNGYEELKDSSKKKLELINNYEILDSFHSHTDIIKRFVFPKNTIRGYCWLLFIKNEKIVNFNTELRYLEDTLFYLENFCNNKKILFLNEYYYIYKYNDISVTKSKDNFINNINMMIGSYEKIKKFCIFEKYSEEFVDAWIVNLIFYRIDYISRITNRKEFINICKNLYSIELFNKLIFKVNLKNIGLYKSIQIILFKFKLFSMIYLLNDNKNKLKG